MSKILILGMGSVGRYTLYWLDRIRHDVTCYDPNIEQWNEINGKSQYDFIFVCTHEKVITKALNNALNNFCWDTDRPIAIIIRSTTSIGHCTYLEEKLQIPVIHLPEFLPERDIETLQKPKYIVIGFSQLGDSKFRDDFIRMFYEMFSYWSGIKYVMFEKQSYSEFVKLAINSYLATQITFWNEVFPLMTKNDLDAGKLNVAFDLEKRISDYGRTFFGKPFKGKCLAKDVITMIEMLNSMGVKDHLLNEVVRLNEELVGRIEEEKLT